MRKGLQIAIAAALAFVPPAVAQDATPEETIREAEKLQKEGSLTKAAELYNSFLADNPNHIRTFDVEFQLAVIADHQGDPGGAIERFQRVLERSKGKTAAFKGRGEAYMTLGKLQATMNRHEDAVKTFTDFLAEGAGLYEDEAYNLCGGYHAILGNYDKAAAMFNILKRRERSLFKQEAGYKLAAVWLRAGKIDLATAAVEDFARENAGHPRTPELFLKIARHYYEAEEYRKTAAVCEQIRNRFAKSPEAAKAVYLIALCSKSAKQFDRAVESLLAISKLYATRDRELAMEAIFEAAQIEHKELKNIEKAMDLYAQAAAAARDMKSLRQRKVREYCYFQMAEQAFKDGKWQAALDLYLILQKISPELDINGRLMQCKAKLTEDGTVAFGGDSKAEREFILKKIADNPGTLVAAQGEVYLADRDMVRAVGDGGRRGTNWRDLDEALAKMERVLGAYPADMLDKDGLRAYIYTRLGYGNGLAAAGGKQAPADAGARVKKAIGHYEKGLGLAGDNPYRIEMLENLAKLSHFSGDARKAFDTYRTLYKETSEAGGEAGEGEIDPFDYVKSMSTLATTDSMIDEVVTILENNLKVAPKSSPAARDSMFYLADLYFLKKRYSQAAKIYKAYVKTHGPEQDDTGEVLGHLRFPDKMDEQTERLYDAAARIAHCWFMQGNKADMLKAYAWITRNQPGGGNKYLPEAWYYVATAMPENDDTAKETKARKLWENLVNRSVDFGSKAYGESFQPWIQKGVIAPRADDYVRNGMLRAGELYSGVKRHETAAEVFAQYLALESEFGADGGPWLKEQDDNYHAARYALGRELVAIADFDRLAEVFRAYLEGGRGDRFRISGLMMLGHYGTKAELWTDAAEAYATLLDEYGPPNPSDDKGNPIPVPKEQRLRPKSNWDGIRMEPPEDLDFGSVRFSLGYMYWQKDEPAFCTKALAPFLDSAVFAENKSRDQALMMLGRSYAKLKDYPKAIAALSALLRGYPAFRGAEEAGVDLARACYKAEDWASLKRAYDDFNKSYPESDRRPYLDLYHALMLLETGDPGGGMSKLNDLADADTYEDVKADAHYHLGRLMVLEVPMRLKGAMVHLTESVKLFPRAEALFEAGRCARLLEDYEQARAFLNQALREFPDADPELLNRTEAELKTAAAAEAKTN